MENERLLIALELCTGYQIGRCKVYPYSADDACRHHLLRDVYDAFKRALYENDELTTRITELVDTCRDLKNELENRPPKLIITKVDKEICND